MRVPLAFGLAAVLVVMSAASGSASPAESNAVHAAVAAAEPPQVNPIVLENRHPGTTAWRIPWAGHSVANDTTKAIKGYASAASVDNGATVAIRVHAASAGPASYRLYRLGWYQGTGAREMARGTFTASPQPNCVTQMPTGLITCPWSNAFTVQTQQNWTSGVYVVVLTRGTVQSYASFVVRDDARQGALVHMQSTLTMQAYNNYPNDGRTGKSLYAYNSFGPITLNGFPSAVKASFDRPFADSGAGAVMTDDAPTIRYTESRGFDVTYATDMDLHADPGLLTGQEALISVGHDEYWTREMFTAAEQARDAGIDIAFLGANNVYWQVRLEPSSAGTPNRTMVSYREAHLDPVKDGSRTVLFRDIPRPEQPLIGQMWPTNDSTGMTRGDDAWVVEQADHWFYRGTGLRNGSRIPMLVGIEVDRRLPEFPGPVLKAGTTQAVLAGSTFVTRRGDNIGLQESTLYQAPSDAHVFSAGTLRYPRGLLGDGPAAQQSVRTMTTNLLARFTGMPLDAGTTRVGGQNRYLTAVELSKHAFPSGAAVPAAYLATGANFPDALAAAAATGGTGPVLLVPRSTSPQAVLDELARLRPSKLVVVGGSAIVSDAVMASASAAAGVPAVRMSGPDRYATAAALSRATFAANVPIAYVATGANFPDALSAGAAAAQLGGPVLLTASTVLPAATRAELARLRPQRIVVVGGSGVVSSGVRDQLAGLAPQTVRLGGVDRYETAMRVARDLGAPATADTVGLATSLDFPDALAAGPAIAAAGGWLLPVGASVTPALAEELVRADPRLVLAAGLAGAIPDGVLSQVRGLFAPLSTGTPAFERRSLTPNDPDIPDSTWQTQVPPYPPGTELPWLELPSAEWQHDPVTG
ncbi:cell wall-binding repeat-containing protein [Agromyces sp. SYSU K20354]|uniref:cell wall-binding repeat-containing protein n=1 Tax=Agromyces cavernae TaxID=2898659 RepID=UPI001E5B28F6|nr:cell wall-binding repeat-containing protein [Agromyces cavernae]MCD2441353.1 cell wall-binding repeat-containing protein [Agromyces cavernae]